MRVEKRSRSGQVDLKHLRLLYIKTKSPEMRVVIKRKIDAETVRRQIRDCTECELYQTRKKSVAWSGPHDGSAKLVLIGEAPGKAENDLGMPFIGAGGRLLNTLLRMVDMERDEVATLTTISCRPPDYQPPTPEQVNACRPNLDAQLELIGGWIGVALGGPAMANVLGMARKAIQVEEMREKMVWKNGRVWICTYDPSQAVRDREKEKAIVQDLLLAAALHHSDVMVPSLDYPEVQIFGRSGEEIGAVIEKQGWALVYANRIGYGVQIIILDDRVSIKKPIPRELEGLTKYTIDELLKLGLAGGGKGTGGYMWTRKQLAQLHMVKTEFDAEVIS